MRTTVIITILTTVGILIAVAAWFLITTDPARTTATANSLVL